MNGLHHLHLRKRDAQHLEPYPSPDAFKRFFDRLMYIVSFGGALALVPQVTQVYATQNASELSLTTWFFLGFFNLLWIMYGILHRAYPILIGSIASALLQFSLVFAILIYS